MSLSKKYNQLNDVSIDETTIEDLVVTDDLTVSGFLKCLSKTDPFLPPSVTTTQKNAIVSPSTGSLVYDSTLNSMHYFNSTWSAISTPNYIAGDLIKTTIFNIADYNFITAQTLNGDSTIWTFSFTPQNTSSYLLIDFYTMYENSDQFEREDAWSSKLLVNGAIVGKTQQITFGQQSALLPITGKYTNSSLTAKTIEYNARRVNAVANIIFAADNTFSSLVIREIKR